MMRAVRNVEQVMTHEYTFKMPVLGLAALAILLGVFLFDLNIAELKESETLPMEKIVLPVQAQEQEKLKAVSELTENQGRNLAHTAVVGGCRSAQDFVNVNRFIEEVADFESFTELLQNLQFANGEVQYPPVVLNGALLKNVQTFFNRVNVFSKEELDHCVTVLQRAHRYNMVRVS